MADLEMTIRRSQKPFDIVPYDDEDRAYRNQSFGIAYRDRYQRTGFAADLVMAVQQSQGDFTMTINEDSDRVLTFQRLGAEYGNRSPSEGSIADLEIVTQQSQKDLNMTPQDHQQRAYQLHLLGIAYRDRYQRTGTIADLERAIQRYEEALDITPHDPLYWPFQLRNLGVGYRDRYQKTGAVADLEMSIQRFQESLDITLDDDPFRTNRLENLGNAHRDRYQKLGEVRDLKIAIQRYQEALDLSPDHPDRARRLHNLGVIYRDRYLSVGAVADNESAIQRFTEALAHVRSHPIARLRSGQALLRLHAEARNWSLAYKAASESVALIPLITPRSLQNTDKQPLVIEIASLASDAAAVASAAGEASYEAIRLLERSRGIIIGSLSAMRTDTSELEQKHPQLAKEYNEHRNQLNLPAVSTQIEANERYDASQRLEKILQDIRRLPEFDRFLLGPSENELKATANWGPIIIINASDYRCDALIIGKRQLQTLPLPLLNTRDIRSHTKTLKYPESLDIHLLEWLWETIAKPVLDTLGFTQSPRYCWPRVWWVPTGPLARFPIHAAGRHTRDSSDTVLDRVISSYSSSISALIYNRQNRPKAESAEMSQKAVLVSMQKTPGQSDLQFAAQEIDWLNDLCNSMQLKVDKPQPCRADVLSALNDCRIFHLAGHGHTDPLDPAKSSLILRDKPLTVASLFETNIFRCRPFLAYLSACGTGQIQNDELLDEGLHLIGACQLAGFQHVIGTLWKVNDKSCVDVATITYKRIREQCMSDESVSEGLHRACRSLRREWVSENAVRTSNRHTRFEVQEDGEMLTEQLPSNQSTVRGPRDVISCDDTPLYWVPYVHFGI